MGSAGSNGRLAPEDIMRPPDGVGVLHVEKRESARQFSAEESEKNIFRLPRGGVYVNTCIGPIQFGIPPETLKDILNMGLDLPQYYVIVGDEMFDRTLGVSVAEFEFPAYYNFFIKNQKMNLICFQHLEKRVRDVFQEALLGPAIEALNESLCIDYGLPAGTTSHPQFPHFTNEGIALDPVRKQLKVDTLLEFKHFLPQNMDKVTIEKDGNKVQVRFVATRKQYKVREISPHKKEVAQLDGAIERIMPEKFVKSREVVFTPFTVPMFGVTVLGSSHGFDREGTTTGFVVWMNRRGLIVDPPPNSNEVLIDMGIAPSRLDALFLTHCHADHDAGTFQKLLLEDSIDFYSTTTVKNSFVRKYSAISGFPTEFLNALFNFVPCTVGRDVQLHGGTLKVHYSLHVIPTAGLEVRYRGKSLIYSADTRTDMKLFKRMLKEKLVTQERYDQLKQTPLSGDHTVILHEAGVPPIHTPAKSLAGLPDMVKKRLYVVHTAANSIDKEDCLKTAVEWSTLTIDVKADETEAGFVPLKTMSSVNEGGATPDELAQMKRARVREMLMSNVHLAGLINEEDKEGTAAILNSSDVLDVKKAESIVKWGKPCAKLYMVLCGKVQSKFIEHVDVFKVGDFFGTDCFLGSGDGDGNDRANARKVTSLTDAHLISLDPAVLRKYRPGVVAALTKMAETMATRQWLLFSMNKMFSSLSLAQKLALHKVIQGPLVMNRGDHVHYLDYADENGNDPRRIGKKMERAFILIQGEVSMEYDAEWGQELVTFRNMHTQETFSYELGPGAFIGDVNGLLKDEESYLVCKVLEDDTQLYYVEKPDFLAFCQAYPGLKLRILDKVCFKGKHIDHFGTISEAPEPAHAAARQAGIVKTVDEGHEDSGAESDS